MNLYSVRREKLISKLDGDCAIILFSGNAVNRSEDDTYPFSVNRNFYYLTGLEKESMVLVISRTGERISEDLFILPYDELLAKWVGGRMKADEAREICGIPNVHDFSALDGYVQMLFNRNRKDPDFSFYFDLWHYDKDQSETPALKYVKKIREFHPAVYVKDIYPYIAEMRLVKDAYEVACIRRALEITNAGVRKMMSSIRPGVNEMSMEGLFKFVLAQNLCKETAFDTICAAGERATVLHYHNNDQTIQDGDLLLVDLGATYNHYCADISRTFPANGKFTDRQKEIYEIVLQAQKIVEENAAPGVSVRELNDKVVEFYREELPKHGLDKDVSEYYYHSVSHHLGLDTHDIDGGLGAILKPGNVITNEPGLYIADEGIGIRIENDLLITEEGCEDLAVDIPRTVEDVEETAAR